MVLPCDLELEELDGFEVRTCAAVLKASSLGTTVSREGDSDSDSNSFQETIQIDECSPDGLSGLWSLGTEEPPREPFLGVPPLLRHLGRRVLGFFALLATG